MAAVCVGVLCLMGGRADAILYTVSLGTSDGNPLTIGDSDYYEASADFSIVGGNLQVVLTNTSMEDVFTQNHILTALFFDVEGVGALTPLSAMLTSGSVYWFDTVAPFPADGNVGGEWAYASGLVAPGGATEGISSAGFGLFGDGNFGGTNLQDPAAIDGVNYGLTSAGDNMTTGEGKSTAVTGDNPLIQNSVTFTLALSGVPVGWDLAANLTHVGFQYGTAVDNPDDPFIPVPEPVSMVILGSLGGGMLAARKLTRKRSK